MKWICLAVCLSILCVGCASSINLHSMDGALASGDYTLALSQLEGRADELKKAQGEIVLNLDMGMMRHYARQPEASNQSLSNAENLISDAYTKSFTQGVATTFFNDNAQDYAGEDFEDIYANVFKALNYQMLGNTEEAMVEIRRSSEKQQVLKNKYQKLLQESNQKAGQNGVTSVETQMVSVEFSHSALSDWLGMLFARTLGDTNDMNYYYRQIKEAFSSQPTLFPFAPPSSIDAELAIPEGLARVNVIAFSGREPEKVEDITRVPLPNGQWMKIALPVMKMRNPEVKSVTARIGGQEIVLEPLESLAAVASNTFLLRKEAIYNKAVLRSAMKALGAGVVGEVAAAATSNGNSGSGGRLLGDSISFFLSLFNDATENADLRMSHFYPGQSRVGGINVVPGVYDVEIFFRSASGTVLGNVLYRDCHVRQGQLNLCEGVYLR